MPGTSTRFAASTLIGIALVIRSVTAASVIAPTFQELVAEAQTVIVGQVTSSQSRWSGAGQRRTIVTDVTVAVDSTLKGEAASVRVLRFLGGTVDDQTLQVPDIPRFKVGDRAVLFVTGDVNAISPLVGVTHGRFPINRAPDGYDYVTLHDGRTLSTVSQIGPASVMASRTPLKPMRREDFEREIRLELQRNGGGR